MTSTLTVQEINDALDLAECCVHDQIADPNEREWVHKNLRKLRDMALSSAGGTRGRDALKAALDSQDFYEWMQQYRHAPVTDQDEVIRCFELVKTFVLSSIPSVPSPAPVPEEKITESKGGDVSDPLKVGRTAVTGSAHASEERAPTNAAGQADEAEVASPSIDSMERSRGRAHAVPSEEPMSAVPESAPAAPQSAVEEVKTWLEELAEKYSHTSMDHVEVIEKLRAKALSLARRLVEAERTLFIRRCNCMLNADMKCQQLLDAEAALNSAMLKTIPPAPEPHAKEK